MITQSEIDELRRAGLSDDEILKGYRAVDKENDADVGALQGRGLKSGEILTGLARFHAASPKAETWGDTAANFGKALQYGAGDVVSGVGKTAEAAGATTAGEIGGTVGKAIGPAGYKSASSQFDVFSPSTYGYAPRALVESAPGLLVDLAGGAVGGAAGALAGGVGAVPGAIAGFTAAHAARSYGRNLEDRLAVDGKKLSDATAKDYAITGASTAAEGALGAVGIKGLPVGRLEAALAARGLNPAVGAVTKGAGAQAVAQLPGQIVGAGVRDAAANAAGNAVQQVGRTAGTDSGLDVNAHELANAAGLGGVTGAGVRGVMGARDVYQSQRLRGMMDDPESSTRVAGALQGTELDLANPKGAADAMRLVQGQLQRATKGEDAKGYLREVDPETRTAVVDSLDRLRIGQTLTESQLSDLGARLSGDTRGASLLTGITDLHTLNRLKTMTVSDGKRGVEGQGFANSTVGRLTNPFGRIGLGTAAGLGAATQIPVAAAALSHLTPYGAAALGGAAAIQGVGRGVDGLLQTRAPVDQFARRFADFRETAPFPAEPGIPAYAPQAADPRQAQQTDRAWSQFGRQQVADEAAAARRENDFSRAYQSLDVDPQVKARQEEAMWRAQAAQEAAQAAPRGYEAGDATAAIRDAYAARERDSRRVVDADAAIRARVEAMAQLRSQQIEQGYAQARTEAAAADRVTAGRERDFERAQAQVEPALSDRAKAAQIAALYKAKAAEEARQAQPRGWDDAQAIQAIRQAEAARQAQNATIVRANAIERAAQNPTPIDDVVTAQPKAQVKPEPKADTKTKAKPDPKTRAQGDSFEHEGLTHPIPDDVRNRRGYIESIKHNQSKINRAIDRAYDDGQIEQTTYVAIRDRVAALKTARNKAQARNVVSEILEHIDPVDAPKVKGAFGDKFYEIWKKDE